MTTASISVLQHVPELREICRQIRSCKFLPREQYLALLLRHRRLSRYSTTRTGLEGVFDAASGEYFLIKHEALRIGGASRGAVAPR